MTQSPPEAVQQILHKMNVLAQVSASVTYHSLGRVLIIGSVDQVILVQPRLKQLQIFVLLTEPCSVATQLKLGKTNTLIEVEKPYSLKGYFGTFSLNNSSQIFDLVLDMQVEPLLDITIPPVGYYALERNNQTLTTILDEISDRVGYFDKPKFFTLDASVCAHGRNGIQGCHQCLDACATQAISSDGSTVKIDPYLCQGCGDCSTVCPSGAINYNYPPRSETVNRIRSVIKAFRQAGGQTPTLLLHDLGEDELILPERGNIIPYQLEAIGAVGIDIWLSALALGAVQVCIYITDRHTTLTQQVINEQLQLAHEILQGMGYSTDLIIKSNSINALGELSQPTIIPPAQFAGIDDKRALIRMAVDHLYQHCLLPIDRIALTGEALFGRIEIDSQNCTLCFACVSTCPAGALASGQELPQLKFIEANCIQCGLCQSACPEQVISLVPEYYYDSIKARAHVLLNEEEAFHCIQCQKAFATKSMIDTIRIKLQDHPMFQGENINKLSLCEDCRVIKLFGQN